jgi:hypothetical protein
MLMKVEKSAWLTFKAACLNFLGNVEVENCKELFEDSVSVYQFIGCNMSLKNHFLRSHLDFFPRNLSDEYGDRFHQDFFHYEEKPCTKSPRNTLAEYSWNRTEEVSLVSYKRMSYRKRF